MNQERLGQESAADANYFTMVRGIGVGGASRVLDSIRANTGECVCDSGDSIEGLREMAAETASCIVSVVRG